MNWLLLFLCCAAFVELFSRIALLRHVGALKEVLFRSARVLRSPRISDHWKERVLLRYAGQLFYRSAMIFLLLSIALSPFLVATLGAGAMGLEPSFVDLLASFEGVVASTGFAVVYAVVRLRHGLS